MLDLSVRLRENERLQSLLSHYAWVGAEDRTVWQIRVMTMDGVGAEQLTLLLGELLALDAIEKNTGHAVLLPDGALSACYRVTQTGLREFSRLNGVETAEELEPTAGFGRGLRGGGRNGPRPTPRRDRCEVRGAHFCDRRVRALDRPAQMCDDGGYPGAPK
jgi:hypothetical protein